MPEALKREIARTFYEESWTKEEIMKIYKVRPKTLQTILGEYRDKFVKES